MTDAADSAIQMARYRAVTRFIDHDAPEIADIVTRALASLPPDATDTDRAIRLFDAVRDGWRYDPYSFALDADSLRASTIARQTSAYCVPKAILLAAVLRAAGIPAALGFADVRNHLNTPKLAELMGTDLFIFHGYVQLWANGKSWKVTPAFNSELCERFGVKPLVFDGTADALFHAFDQEGRQHMEYVNDRGLFADMPLDDFLTAFRATYPRLVRFHENRASAPGTAAIDPGFAASGAER